MAEDPQALPCPDARTVRELLDEGLEILNGIIDSVKRRGNYSPESTCVFIDQAGQCLREALSAITTEPAAPEGRQEAVARVSVRKEGVGGLRVEWLADMPPPGTELYTRPAEQAATEAGVEAAAKLITKWLGKAWDGLHDGRIADKGFPVFTHGQFGWGFQGYKGDMIDLARAALEVAKEAEHHA